MEHKDYRVSLKVDIPESLDRAIEVEVFKRRITKRQFVEDVLRAALKPVRSAA